MWKGVAVPRLGGTHAHSRHEAEIAELTRVLRSYGVLTRDYLEELSGARHWDGAEFECALNDGVRAGRIKRLSPELYEVAPHPER
jgi:hypothetical protein